ncbi:unnamed protein product [Triticum turgidum subsp. durum]|uniref:Exocyst complex component Sec8 n=1 Tax=Triticum turgidum subsp. durum TaxID=4567 RepID=A0A9R1A1Q5_TRITD|nr:unnamed protein product [Triticum turgidum subsp. durum]
MGWNHCSWQDNIWEGAGDPWNTHQSVQPLTERLGKGLGGSALRVEFRRHPTQFLEQQSNKVGLAGTPGPRGAKPSLTGAWCDRMIARRDEEMAPYIPESKRNYVFGGISSVAANASIKALAAIPSIDSEAVQQRLDRVRTFYELLNLPFESLLGFVAEQEYIFSAKEYLSILKVNVPGREIPMDAERRISQILSH